MDKVSVYIESVSMDMPVCYCYGDEVMREDMMECCMRMMSD